MGRFIHDDYVELTMHFRCNLRCEHCMIEGTMDWLEPEPISRFDEVLAHNQTHRRWNGLILTGAEITLRKDLPELAKRARASGFQHVRIQSHGMRLADEQYARELVAAGVDEYFISVTAGDADRHDSITQVPGSFDKTVRGLEMLDQFPGVMAMTNTVVTRRSYDHLPLVVERLGHLKNLVQMEFWNYWPMKEADDKNLIVSHLKVLPFLKTAIKRCRELGRDVEVKNFPECLLEEDAWALENHQPKLLIDPAFWSEFRRNGFHQCVHQPECQSKKCLGLNTAYVKEFGWQGDRLKPIKLELPVLV